MSTTPLLPCLVGAASLAVVSGGPLILVVDDYEDSRELLGELLEVDGYAVVMAADGPQALAAVRELRPRLVLLDLMLPTMSGWDVARLLKADPATAGICIVACTASASSADHWAAIEAGCSAVLSKPLDYEKLRRVVHEATR